MNDLHLHVKSEYFKAIKRGEKTEEYRQVKDYWLHRLSTIKCISTPMIKNWEYLPVAHYDNVVIHNAYKAGAENVLTFPWRGWHLKGITHPHFGPEEVTVFAIKLEK